MAKMNPAEQSPAAATDGQLNQKISSMPSLETRYFQATFGKIQISFQLVKMIRSCYIWIGDDRKILNNVSLAMPSPFDSVPLLTQIVDRQPSDAVSIRDEGKRIASRLSKKLNAQVFVTYAVAAPSEIDIVGSIDVFLAEMIRNGEKFTL